MKKIIAIVFIFFLIKNTNAQPLRIAILDFDNISGIAKYDGLGKAMSSMLISDIESNVSPKRLQLVERAQINKIMKEQNLQKSTSFDKSTSVKMGRLLGVNFLLIGDIYILDNSLVINARLTDASSGDIKFSEKQEGKINEWLTVKSKLGKSVSTSISMPFTQPRIPDGIISPAVLTTYASAIDENDKGNFEKAETLISTAKEFNPDFGYLDDLRDEVEKLKKQVKELQIEVETTVDNPIQSASNFLQNNNFIQAIKYFRLGLNRIPNTNYGEKYAYFIFLSDAYLKNNNFSEALNYADSALLINPLEVQAIFTKAKSLFKLNKQEEGITLLKNRFVNNGLNGNMEIFLKALYNFSMNNRSFILKGLGAEYSAGSTEFMIKIQYPSFEEFKKDYGNFFKFNLFEINSSGYQFHQTWSNSQLIPMYIELLSTVNIDAISLGKLIDELDLGNDSNDVFNVFYNTGEYGNTMTGRIVDSTLYVIAKTGETYVGPAHFNSFGPSGIFGKGIYSNSNSRIHNYIISIFDSIYEFKKNAGMNQYSANIECPCYALIESSTYKEFTKNKTKININSLDFSTKYFNSGWYYLLGRQYKLSIDRFQAVVNYYIKLGRSIKGSELSLIDYDEYRMAIINLGHTYLLGGDYLEAEKKYKNDILYRDFGENFGNISKEDVIKNDWNDFIEKGLVTKSQLTDFNNKFKIISNF